MRYLRDLGESHAVAEVLELADEVVAPLVGVSAVGAHRESRFLLIESRVRWRVPAVRLAALAGPVVGCVDELGERLGEGLVLA